VILRFVPRPKRPAAALTLIQASQSRRIPAAVRRVAMRKLLMLDKVQKLEQLRIPPANRLEALTGDRAGQHSGCGVNSY
jgi:proteic killer suppression protein